MYYVYILKHPTENRIYIGFSADLRGRRDATGVNIPVGGSLIMKRMLQNKTPERESGG